MPIRVSAKDVAIEGAAEIALPIKITAEGGAVVDTATLKGLPPAASVSEAQKVQDAWVIPFAKLADAKLGFSELPEDAVRVEVVVAGSEGGKPQTAQAEFTISPAAAGAVPSFWEKFWIFAIVLLVTVLVFMCWRLLYEKAQKYMTDDYKASWAKPDDVSIRANSTTTFWYDPAKKELVHRGPIDVKEKQVLQGLAKVIRPPAGAKADAAKKAGAGAAGATDDEVRLDSYLAAIDDLTYKSNKEYSKYFLCLLALAGLSGVLGTQIRSLSNFVFIATRREKQLDIRVWWPYYVVRPVTGFLLGLLAVLLVEAKLYVPDTQALPSGTVWWMGIAMLIGFASEEFGQRLRLTAQALFGKESKKDD